MVFLTFLPIFCIFDETYRKNFENFLTVQNARGWGWKVLGVKFSRCGYKVKCEQTLKHRYIVFQAIRIV